MPLPRWSAVLAVILLVSAGCEGERGEEEERTPAVALLFVEETARRNLVFTHDSGARGDLLFPEMMGSGVAVFDTDSDGDLDLYFVSGAPGLGAGPSADGPFLDGSKNRLFLQGTDGRFADATEGSGLGDAGFGTGVAVGDVNNDGHDDVFVANFGPDRLFLARGDGTFEDVTRSAGIAAT